MKFDPKDYPHGDYIIKYRMPDGKIKSVQEHSKHIKLRLERLDWAKLEVLSIEKKRET